MLCGWEGNHGSGVALAMRHGFGGLSNGQLMGDERAACALDAFSLRLGHSS